jgi:hypothetical protein
MLQLKSKASLGPESLFLVHLSLLLLRPSTYGIRSTLIIEDNLLHWKPNDLHVNNTEIRSLQQHLLLCLAQLGYHEYPGLAELIDEINHH